MKRPTLLGILLVILTDSLFAQPGTILNENCTVSILNRTARVNANGTWQIDNIPANFEKVRVRVTCVKDGVTTSGQSDFITFEPGIQNGFSPLVLGNAIPIPERLEVSAATTNLTSDGATAQLRVTAFYPDGSSAEVTASTSRINYRISNPEIASISAEGLVTAHLSGTVLVSAMVEGALSVLRMTVTLSGDKDRDGIPDDVELAHGLNPCDRVDGFEDEDEDGLTNKEELVDFGTNHLLADTDGDSIGDGEEAIMGQDGFITNPTLADSDGDIIPDGVELQLGTDPTDPASVNLASAIRSFEVTPDTTVLTVNTIIGESFRQLEVSAELINGDRVDLTSTDTGTGYNSSDLSIVNFGAPDGRIFAGDDGSATVTVNFGPFSDTVAVTVTSFAPTPLGSVQIPGYANNVDVGNDNYAYVAAGSAGLQIVDVANPLAPSIVGSVDTPGNANDVRVVGVLVYLADGGSGLQIIDASDPTAPQIIGSLDTPGTAQDLKIANETAYIADGVGGGLQIVDVSNPVTPALIGSVDTPGDATGVDVVGQTVVLADERPSRGIRIIDVANPANPLIVGNLTTIGGPKDLAAEGNYAYVSAFASGFHVVDFNHRENPVVVHSIPGGGSGFIPRDVEISGRFALAAEQLFGDTVTPIVDISNPENPIFRATVTFPPPFDNYSGTGIAVTREFVYLTAKNSGVADDYGTNGVTRLFVGQYRAFEDHEGMAPSVQLTSPQQGIAVEGSTLKIAATATDDIAVSNVEFLLDGNVVGSDSTPPYEISLALPLGVATRTVQARAVDFGGNLSLSEEVVVSVIPDGPPTVSITSPSAGQSVVEDGALSISANATDDVGVAVVVFFVDGQVVGTDSTAPYSFNYVPGDGPLNREISVFATDAPGQFASATVTLTVTPVNDPPIIEVTNDDPGDGKLRVGYYDMSSGQGVSSQVDPIVTAGHTPVQIFDLTPEELSNIDVLLAQNPNNNGYSSEYPANLANIEAAVTNGLVLVVHDRRVIDAETILPGGANFQIDRDLSAAIDVLQPESLVADGPGGRVTDSTLDGGDSSNHGHAIQGSLPVEAELLLSAGNPAEIVDFSYPHGSGFVYYSTIPLDAYLAGTTPAAFRIIYAPNVVAYAASLSTVVRSNQTSLITEIDAPLVIHGVTISDSDISQTTNSEMTVTLVVTNGSISLADVAGLSFVAGNGTSEVEFVGPLDEVNEAVDQLRFSPAAGFEGIATVTMTANDNGHTGAPGPLTGTLTLEIVVAAPSPSVFGLTSLEAINPAAKANSALRPLQAEAYINDEGERSVRLYFESTVGKTYQLQRSENLKAPWANLGMPFSGMGEVRIEVREEPTMNRCFYRLTERSD